MPVPLLKRGANQAGCLVSILHAGPPSLVSGGGEWHGQALQGDTIPDPAGRVGRFWIYIIFYVFALKCLFLRGFQTENGIFAIFNPKIWTCATIFLKVGFILDFRVILANWSP
jgi:hypothetical protein